MEWERGGEGEALTQASSGQILENSVKFMEAEGIFPVNLES